eukprot:2332931-Rhodomonas_salina.2
MGGEKCSSGCAWESARSWVPRVGLARKGVVPRGIVGLLRQVFHDLPGQNAPQVNATAPARSRKLKATFKPDKSCPHSFTPPHATPFCDRMSDPVIRDRTRWSGPSSTRSAHHPCSPSLQSLLPSTEKHAAGLTSPCPFIFASRTALLPSLFRRFTSAPALTRARALRYDPAIAAWCSALRPSHPPCHFCPADRIQGRKPMRVVVTCRESGWSPWSEHVLGAASKGASEKRHAVGRGCTYVSFSTF